MNEITSQEPIPVPIRYRWREVRIRALPVVAVLAALAAVLHLWRTADGGGVSGMAEGRRAMVSAPRAGILRSLLVEPFEPVEAGRPLLIFEPVEPRADLNLLQSELQLARLRLEPSIADRNALNYEQVRLELLLQRQQLALARVNLERAEKALQRNESLRRDRLVSEDVYELSLRDRDLFRAQVAEISKTIGEMEDRFEELSPLGEPLLPGANALADGLVDDLESRLTEASTGWKSQTLTAPIDGMVHTVLHQAGESVLEGEPLLTIHSHRAERIVAYLRQPYRVQPHEGMPVEVSTRNPPRQRFETRIDRVGAQLESITNALAMVPVGRLVDLGLQVVIPVPVDLAIRPGEIVDVRILDESRATPSQFPTQSAASAASNR